MQIIKLDATDSTNAHLKRLTLSGQYEDLTVVIADRQLQGRGQRGTRWQSEAGKNLTFSVLKKNLDLPVADCYALNVCVSLAIFDMLRAVRLPDLKIKWPNDILSGTSKICGILIENVLSGSKINTSVIGIGLNVNQMDFDNLQNASSLKLLLGRTFDLDELLHKILYGLEAIFLRYEKQGLDDIWNAYESELFRKGKPSTFEKNDGGRFMGFIKGVSKDGKLIIDLGDNVREVFDLKEVHLLY